MNPFALPVHPAVVHFPIAMLVVAWAAQLVAYSRGSASWHERSRFLETIGVFALPVVVVAGFIDTRGVGFLGDVRWDQPLVWHVLASSAAVGVWTAHWIWQRRGRAVDSTRGLVIDLGATTLGVWLLFLTGSIAGEMVYGT